jgi:hypothetical protein
MKTFLAFLAGVALCLIAVILYGTELNLQKATSAPGSITQGAPSALRYGNAAGKDDAQARYHSCVSRAETYYSDSWAAECKRVQNNNQRPDCALPVGIASDLNAGLEKGRDRCLQEVNAGLR